VGPARGTTGEHLDLAAPRRDAPAECRAGPFATGLAWLLQPESGTRFGVTVRETASAGTSRA
jgi:hypothetical protein